MITQCSHCNTKFEISAELVESDDPRVRCGECLNVFNARVQLVVESSFEEPSIPTVTQKVAERSAVGSKPVPELQLDMENYVSPEDLENAATIVMDEQRESMRRGSTQVNDGFYSPDLQLDHAAGRTSGKASDNEFAQTLAFDTDADAAGLDAETKPRRRDPAIDPQSAIDAMDERASAMRDTDIKPPAASENRRRTDDSAQEIREHIRKRGGKLPIKSEAAAQPRQRSMAVPLLCVALGFAALLYFARESIAQLDLPEPLLANFCSVTGCELPLQKDLSRLELLQHRTNIHPELEDVLVINVDVINTAPFPQPYPVLAVRMAGSAGETIAQRKFAPSDYIEADKLDDSLPAGEQVRIRFEILDPGPEAVTSELVFE